MDVRPWTLRELVTNLAGGEHVAAELDGLEAEIARLTTERDEIIKTDDLFDRTYEGNWRFGRSVRAILDRREMADKHEKGD